MRKWEPRPDTDHDGAAAVHQALRPTEPHAMEARQRESDDRSVLFLRCAAWTDRGSEERSGVAPGDRDSMTRMEEG